MQKLFFIVFITMYGNLLVIARKYDIMSLRIRRAANDDHESKIHDLITAKEKQANTITEKPDES